MTNEQLAILLADYYKQAQMIGYFLETGEKVQAELEIAELEGRLDAAIKTLGVEAFTSPLGYREKR